eukprot:6179982-Pleurochrysis_carterae.AAC.3
MILRDRTAARKERLSRGAQICVRSSDSRTCGPARLRARSNAHACGHERARLRAVLRHSMSASHLALARASIAAFRPLSPPRASRRFAA